MTTEKGSNLQRATSAYKLAIEIQSIADRLTAEFPTVASKLREATRVAISEGRKAEASK